MQDLTKAQKARVAIQSFKTIAHALSLRGYFMPSEKLGQQLAECLLNLSPEIYGSMADPRVVELKGLEYVIDRLPCGIESCTRIILTEEEQVADHSFDVIEPLKRRRTCYRITHKEMCFAITRGLSEIYDILTHLIFLRIEAKKIHSRMKDEAGNVTIEWKDLERTVQRKDELAGKNLDQALWNLSIILGRSYHETRNSHTYFDKNRKKNQSNNGLFSLIYHLGMQVEEEARNRDNALVIYLTPSLMNIIGHQKYGEKWASDIKRYLADHGLIDRPLHIISANLHSMVNSIYAFGALNETPDAGDSEDLATFISRNRGKSREIIAFARAHGLHELPDHSGTHIDCQIIDTACLSDMRFHPNTDFKAAPSPEAPIILVMDYAFGAQAFEVMDNLLNPLVVAERECPMNIHSISIMGKAGILPGNKGDIMLATAHVLEGSSDNYTFDNDLGPDDFGPEETVYVGPMITVLGTSLQNMEMLKKFQTSWKTVGLEMEGGHYQRAINAAIIKGHIRKDIKIRYAYYASDNPLLSGQTLAAGEMGDEGIRPTYMVTRAILNRIMTG